jgi:hypothetical protein
MGRSKGWGSQQTGRPVMRSPGRPPVGRREHRQRFWAAIARSERSDVAGVEAGVSPVVGVRWFREAGGMPPISQAPLSGRYLSFAERVTRRTRVPAATTKPPSGMGARSYGDGRAARTAGPPSPRS